MMKTAHKCLTCFKDFDLNQAPYRCVNKKCIERDKKLSELMLGTDQIMGTVIARDSNGVRSRKNGECVCHKCGSPTTIQICPDCHAELPTYLDVPGHIVFVLGATGSGKSLYLVATFEHMEKRVFPTHLKSHFEFCTNYSKEKYQKLRDKVYKDGILLRGNPGSRVETDLLLPFIFNATVRSYVPLFYPLSRKKSLNIAAFDTSGEDCANLQTLQWCCKGVSSSSALLILVDPTSFPAIAAQLPLEAKKTSIIQEMGNPKAVIDNVTQFYRASHGLSALDKIPIPTAFVMTKMDALKGFMDPSSLLLQEAQHRNGFDHSYCEQVSNDLKSFLRDRTIGANDLVTAAEANFKDHMFFAVTSLGKPPRIEAGQKRIDNINPQNTENPWLWILYRLGALSEV
jgi:hypothetical protein